MSPPAARPASRSRTRALLIAMVLLALAPIAGLLAWQVHAQLAQERERTQDELHRAAGEFAQSVNRELASSIDALNVLSQSEIFQQGRIAAMGRLLHGRPRRDWDSIFLLDAKGGVVLDTAARPASAESLHELHAQVLRKLAPVFSGTGNSPGIAAAMPILQGGHVIYVLGVRMNDAVWPRLAANASTPDGGQARLYDGDGRLIVQAGMAPAKVYGACADAPVAGWRACVAVPADPIDEERRRTLVHALSTSGVALLAGLVLAAVVGRMVLARLD